MNNFLKIATMTMTGLAAVALTAPAQAATPIAVNVAQLSPGVYGADFSALVAVGTSSTTFNLIFPVAGTGSVSFTSTLSRLSGVQITAATFNGINVDITSFPSGRFSTTYSGGDEVSLSTGRTLPLVLTTFARSTGYVSGNITFASAVPEPASWALMIGGFGVIGGTLRRRTAQGTAAYTAA
ncbi:PEPxxWA-CTERM sorting domain-containing protein [Sphingomonas sp. Leaf343]|uniref:PEPxxWA-CTERM sorting domain-containing protein n=1 Tax=Sphingomonas sp. Leaf343 TaxID=1736345 RepID=UPI000AF250DE|nr:PEPxxWA-CTERM sorting domain-containing protein [Sphingomonas sp. Leaf343]